MADNHDRPVIEAGKASDDRAVIAEQAVAMEFLKVSAELVHIIEGRGTLRMSGQLGSLPGSKTAVKFVFDLREFGSQLANLILRAGFWRFGGGELLNLFFQLTDRFFEIQIISHDSLFPSRRLPWVPVRIPK